MTIRNKVFPDKRNPTLLEKAKCISDFATDGCTMAPDLVFYDFCVEHDVYYATGEINRTNADRILRERICESGYNFLGWLYWLGVRVYGWIPYYFGKNYAMRIEYAEHQNQE